METLSLSVILTLLYAVHFGVSSSKDVFVSIKVGHDGATCGTMEAPCQHLQYAIHHIAGQKDVIKLDGGINESLVYTLNQTIQITKYVTITRWSDRGSKYPILTSTSTQPLFHFINNQALLKCSFKKLFFRDAEILKFSSSVRVVFVKCKLRNIKVINDISSNVTAYITAVHSKIYRSEIEHSKQSKTDVILKVDIRRSIIKHITIKFQHVKIDIIMENTYVLDPSLDLWECKDCKLSMYHCNLEGVNNHRIFVKFASKLKIIGCHFDDVYLYATRAKEISIQDSIFQRISGNIASVCFDHCGNVVFKGCNISHVSNTLLGTIVVWKTKAILFTRSVFVNNTAQFGGAIRIAESVVRIVHSIFTGNRALVSGGTIHSTGKTGHLSFRNVSIAGSAAFQRVLGRLVYSETAMEITNVTLTVHENTETSAIFIYSGREQRTEQCKFKNFVVVCPVGNKVQPLIVASTYTYQSSSSYISLFCKPCGRTKYSLTQGQLDIIENIKDYTMKNITCSPCELGGTCDSRIKSVGNYWGSIGKNNRVLFHPCPPNYCCSPRGSPCLSYNTCAPNRTGKLCGKCANGYSLNFLSSVCVTNDYCTMYGKIAFFIGHITLSILYVIFLMYLKDITRSIEWVLRNPGKSTNRNGEDAHIHSDSVDDIPNDDDALSIVVLQEPTVHSKFTDQISSKRTAGLIKIAFFFYQVEPLLRVDTPIKGNYHYNSWTLQGILSSVFNIKFNTVSEKFIFCPFRGLDAVKKAAIKVSFIGTMFAILLTLYWFHALANKFEKFISKIQSHRRKERADDTLTNNPVQSFQLQFPLRVKRCAIRLFLLGYITISNFAFISVNCIRIGTTRSLYIDGTVECFQWWQWVAVAFICLWVLPFATSLYFGISLLSTSYVTPNEFLVILILPPSVLFYSLRSNVCGPLILPENDQDIARLYLNDLCEPFRQQELVDKPVKWESVLIFRKLAFVCATTFIVHPVGKLYAVLLLLALFMFNHFRVRPYADELLNKVDSCSSLMLCLLASINLFWANIYMSNETVMPHFEVIGGVFLLFEVAVLVLPMVLLVALVLYKVLKKLLSFYKTCIYKQD